MKTAFFIFCAAFILSCNQGGQKNSTTNSDPVTVKNDPAADSTAIRNTIIEFYEWYNKNYTKLMDYHLYEGIKKKDMPPYRINWETVGRYQQYIRENIQWLGDSFLQSQKAFLQECDSAFKVYPEDELPYGFDYDWYTNSQEDPVYTLDMIKQSTSWRIKRHGDMASVAIQTTQEEDGKRKEMPFLSLQMKKENNNWKIARIGNEE